MVVRAPSEEVEGVAVQAVRVFGHCSRVEDEKDTQFLKSLVRGTVKSAVCCTPDPLQDTIAPLQSEVGVTGNMVLCRVLVFLSVLLQDLARLMHRRRMASLEPSMIVVGSALGG